MIVLQNCYLTSAVLSDLDACNAISFCENRAIGQIVKYFMIKYTITQNQTKPNLYVLPSHTLREVRYTVGIFMVNIFTWQGGTMT